MSIEAGTGPRRLSVRDQEFKRQFDQLVDASRETASTVEGTVAEIVQTVRERGDAALLELTRKFDRHEVSQLGIGPAEIDAAFAACPADSIEALHFAAERIRAFHTPQKPADAGWEDEAGVRLGWRWTPLDAVGLYVPGGTASYPSSVLMNAIPAKVAGVGRLVVTVPAPDGKLNPLVLAAARIAGVDEIYRIGGAQAVAALAYGTETIARVDKIVGPGNAYVATAKRQVFGIVGIDTIAGPSEILVVADGKNEPAWIAADLLSQAEHDEVAQSILLTDDAAFADRVEAEVKRQLQRLPRGAIATASWRGHGAIILVDSLADAPALVNRLAPEHLELAVEEPDRLAAQIRHAGAIFLGRMTPEAVGDYVGGPNHVLPTSRTARFASGLGVQDFLKRTTLLCCGPDSLQRLGPAAVRLAEAEGLDAHAASIAIRLGRNR